MRIYNRDTGNIGSFNLFHHIPVNDVGIAADMDGGTYKECRS